MQLIITKENIHLELEDNIKIVANEFGVWFWENFFSVDAKKSTKRRCETRKLQLYF